MPASIACRPNPGQNRARFPEHDASGLVVSRAEHLMGRSVDEHDDPIGRERDDTISHALQDTLSRVSQHPRVVLSPHALVDLALELPAPFPGEARAQLGGLLHPMQGVTDVDFERAADDVQEGTESIRGTEALGMDRAAHEDEVSG
jgi:hypothetical protein